jgi:CBS domain containing-hemolysin-like protein
MAKKPRSKLWIVSTHVLTTGFAFLLLASLIAFSIVLYARPENPFSALGIGLALMAIGYIGGTFYSLSYLKSAAEFSDWTSCTKPSIITFCILALIGFTLNIIRGPDRSALAIAMLVVFYVVVIFAFVKITANGFERLQGERT